MDFFELIQSRYSVRAYKSHPVEEEKLQKILEAARLAPTAANRQPIRVIVIQTAEQKEGLRRIYSGGWFVDAPIVLCVCGVEAEGWVRSHDGKSYLDVDAAIVMDHIVLASTALGWDWAPVGSPPLIPPRRGTSCNYRRVSSPSSSPRWAMPMPARAPSAANQSRRS